MRFPSSSLRPRAFTLLELLVALSVIALLLGILVPVLARAKRTAQALKSQANLRQIQLMTELFKNDSKSLFPRPAESYPRGQNPPANHPQLGDDRRIQLLWYNAIDPYAGLAPPTTVVAMLAGKQNDAAWKQSPAWLGFSGGDQSINRSFKMNTYFATSDDDAAGNYQKPETMVRQPSLTVLFGDGRAADLEGATSVGTNAQFELTTGVVGPRNPNNAVNIVFVDGHVSAEIQPLDTTLASPGWYSETNSKGGKGRTLVWDFTKQ